MRREIPYEIYSKEFYRAVRSGKVVDIFKTQRPLIKFERLKLEYYYPYGSLRQLALFDVSSRVAFSRCYRHQAWMEPQGVFLWMRLLNGLDSYRVSQEAMHEGIVVLASATCSALSRQVRPSRTSTLRNAR